MPPPSNTNHLPPTHPATRQRPKSPNRVLAEAEAQWLFTEDEVANTPSIQDGLPMEEEKERRVKGINFIVQVGIMLKLPQLTLSTASIFFQRFLMRASLVKERNGIPKLHHFQAAGTALFLATKVEESCRKMRELVLAFCRVAQKNPNLVVDEQSKDFWRWRDLILHNEDHMLETLCFDLTVESPHRQLFEMLKYYHIEHNKRLRNSAWGFVTDSNNTQLCLLVSSRTIAVASLYAACKYCDVSLPDDGKARPWWETQHVRLKEIRRAVEYMLANYDGTSNKVGGISASGGSDGNGSIYAGLLTPGMDGSNENWDRTRSREGERASGSASPFVPPGSERRNSNASSVGVKRDREREDEKPANGDQALSNGEQDENKRPRLEEQFSADMKSQPEEVKEGEVKEGEVKEGEVKEDVVMLDGGDPPAPQAPAEGGDIAGPRDDEESLRVDEGNGHAQLDVKASEGNASQPEKTAEEKAREDGEVSEEGEVSEG